MAVRPERSNRLKRAFQKLVEVRWFFTFTSSLCATVIGISLTFGINSCREARRAREEMRKSMLQASDNLNDRFNDAKGWLEIIEYQNEIYSEADSLYSTGSELPDSLCVEFWNAIPYVRIASYDHDFEKIFRGSYQIWQLQSREDSLAFDIGVCYDGLNLVENTCAELTEGMLEKIGEINSRERFYRLPPREWTETLLSDSDFQYFMVVRKVKSRVAADVFADTKDVFDTYVVPQSEKLKN